MKTHPKATTPGRNEPVKALNQVLGQTKIVKVLVDEAAQDLSSVNSMFKQKLQGNSAPHHIEKAIQKSEAIEDKVQEAADKLSVVNATLQKEVRERHALENKLEAITEREEASRHAAVHDPLTGLPNRVLFNDRLEHGLAQARRHGWNLAVMFIDLDAFKQINDTHGHDAGDSVLKTVAARLTDSVRGDDTVSRHGGDEFLYLLTEVKDVQDLSAIAEKLIASIQTPCSLQVGNSPSNPASAQVWALPSSPKTAPLQTP